MYTDNPHLSPHKQCDVLVYNPCAWQPYYQIDEFVVASPDSSTLIVEVKSTIGDQELSDILGMQQYALGVNKPLLAFIYEGWTFNTFCSKLQAYQRNIDLFPICMVVHERNYLAVRATQYATPKYLLIDFSSANPPCPGMATSPLKYSARA